MASKLLSSEQMNFTRVGIVCLDVIKLILKDILNLYIKPMDLYHMIKTQPTKKTELNSSELKLCKKKPFPDYNMFDVSFLYKLISTLGFPKLQPTKGWGRIPSQQHTTIGDDIERLRIFRNNSFAHLHSSSIPDSTFKTRSEKLKIVIGRIEMFMTAKGLTVNYKKQLDDALKSQFDIDDMEKLKIELETLLTVMNKEKKVPKMRGCLSCLRCRGSEDLQRKFYREQGSTVRHALLMSNIEKQRGLLAKLKTELTNLGDLNTSEIDGSESVKDLLCCLLQKKLISNSNVIYLQHLFRRTGSKELNQKCIEYAEGMNALCFYEKHVGRGYDQAEFHIVGDTADFDRDYLNDIRDTVASMLECQANEIFINGVKAANSFILSIAIKTRYIEKLLNLDPDIKASLYRLHIDYFKVEDHKIFTDLSDASQIDSVTIHNASEISHISFITRGELWVSDFDTLLKVDSTGNILNDEYKVRCYPLGSHTVTMDLDLLFVNDNGVHKLSSEGVITTLFTTPKAHCIHSSRFNGNILVGSYDEVTRYNDIGRKLQVIEKDDRGRSLYTAPVYITENKNGDIWTSDKIKGAVVVVDKSGGYRFDYTGCQSHFVPHGICTDVLGQVLVCDVYNHSVNILDQDGQFLSLLLTREQHGVHRPTALCVDDEHNLYLGQEFSNSINVYKYLKDTNVNNGTGHVYYPNNMALHAPKIPHLAWV